MKLHGKTLGKPKNEVLVIPRNGEDYVFTLQAVLDFKEFDMYCPEPKPPIQVDAKTNEQTLLTDNKAYLDKRDKHTDLRVSYMVIKALEATEGIEWEKVKLENPETYSEYEQELRDFGLTERELVMLVETVMKVNGLNNEIYAEAKKRFLAGTLQKEQ